MKCRQVARLVEAYVDGTLTGTDAAQLAAHAGGCPRCDARIEAARRVQTVLGAQRPPRAPRGFAAKVMEAVYREALARPSAARQERNGAPSRMYRRLGLSFVLTAGVLAVSLLVPRLAYPTLVGRGSASPHVEAMGAAVVRSALVEANDTVRGILRAGSAGNGGAKSAGNGGRGEMTGGAR